MPEPGRGWGALFALLLTVSQAWTADSPSSTPAPESAPALTVAVDNSLRGVIRELAQIWADGQDTSPAIELAVANPASLRQQLKVGGPWDLVISPRADDFKAWADQGKIAADTRKQVAINQLGVLGRKALVADDDLDWYELATQEWTRIAVGDPIQSASGASTQAALEKHDLTAKLTGRIRNTGTETEAIDLLLNNEVDAAFVFKSDLISVKLPGFQIFTIQPQDYPSILYNAAVVMGSKKAPLARSFLAYLVSEEAQPVWKKWGFGQ